MMRRTHTQTVAPKSDAFEMRWRGPTLDNSNMLVDFDSLRVTTVQTSLAWHGVAFETDALGGVILEDEVDATIGLAFEWLEGHGARVYAHRVFRVNSVGDGYVVPHLRIAVVPRHFAQFRRAAAGPKHASVSYPVLVVRDPSIPRAQLPPVEEAA